MPGRRPLLPHAATTALLLLAALATPAVAPFGQQNKVTAYNRALRRWVEDSGDPHIVLVDQRSGFDAVDDTTVRVADPAERRCRPQPSQHQQHADAAGACRTACTPPAPAT